MSSLFKFVSLSVIASFALAFCPAIVTAASIGIHFPSNRDNPASQLAPGESAGASGFAQTNWNTTDGGSAATDNASGTTADILSPNAAALSDSTGTATGASVSWSSNGTWNTANGTATPDAKLMNGYADAINAGGFATFNIDNIPYDNYSVVVYFGSDGNGRTGQVTDGTTTYSYSTFSNDPDASGGFDQSDYLQTTDTGVLFPNANYAVFDNLSGGSEQIDIIRGSSNSGVHAIQVIDAIPEPSSIMLFSLGAVGMAVVSYRRRRRR